MKKIYMTPEMEIVDIKASQQLLAGSLPMGSGDVNPNTADAPEFDEDLDFVGF